MSPQRPEDPRADAAHHPDPTSLADMVDRARSRRPGLQQRLDTYRRRRARYERMRDQSSGHG